MYVYICTHIFSTSMRSHAMDPPSVTLRNYLGIISTAPLGLDCGRGGGGSCVFCLIACMCIRRCFLQQAVSRFPLFVGWGDQKLWICICHFLFELTPDLCRCCFLRNHPWLSYSFVFVPIPLKLHPGQLLCVCCSTRLSLFWMLLSCSFFCILLRAWEWFPSPSSKIFWNAVWNTSRFVFFLST